MQRRHLLGALGPLTFRGSNKKTYHAIAAERMPASLESDWVAGIIEVRRYGGDLEVAKELQRLLAFHGAEVRRKGLNFQLAFNTLAEREGVWGRLAADTAWETLRQKGKLVTLEISVFQ